MSEEHLTPPPGDIFERAERAIEYVRKALGQVLDYTPDTLPLLDHYLRSIPPDRAELVSLAAATAGAYFGEVARRALGGEWQQQGESWRLVLAGGIALSPEEKVAEIITRGQTEEHDGTFEVPAADRQAVEEALADIAVPEDEYYSLSGHLETLYLVADILAARRST